MPDIDPKATHSESAPLMVAELEAAGFEQPEEIGRGGFGVVYRCRQSSLDRVVAIKVLLADMEPRNIERFLREQRAMGRLSGHPNIVNVLQADITETGRPYIVMPFHPGGSLHSVIKRSGPLTWMEAIPLGVKVAGALETAHRIGILHRDIKPGNVLLTEYREPQISDFGIARMEGGFETSAGMVTGSPAFTAPEVLSGNAPSAQSDVYALGATLFCAITGHAAYERRSGEQLVAQFVRIASEPVPDLSVRGIPRDVSTAIEHAMAPIPSERPTSAAEFGEELRVVEGHLGLPVDTMVLPSSGADTALAPVLTPPDAHGDPPRHSGVLGRGHTDSATPPTPSTRLRPPTSTHTLVGRERLIEAMRTGDSGRLIVIHGPAGFGKSTLAAQWCKVLAAEGVPSAWLTVDEDDNHIVWFLAHLIDAFRQVRPSLAEELRQRLEEHGDAAERFVLSSLIDDLERNDERVALVIDDWHRVTAAPSIGALGFLIENSGDHLQVIVASRTQAGLPLSLMRVRDELVEIDAADLRFNAGEAQAFLSQRHRLALDVHDIANLTATTDGWVAALQLAALSLRGRTNPTKFISHISGGHHVIGEFLAENVVDSLKPSLLDFLMDTSITERICGDLASVLANVNNGQTLLEEVEGRDLFLSRLPDDDSWFRYHHLFADFLRRRLERDHPERIPVLHRSASRWFAEHEMLSEAVDHALIAGDVGGAVDLVEQSGMKLIERSQMSTVVALTDKLPHDAASQRPRLQIILAVANFLLGEVEAQRKAGKRLQAAVANDGHDPGEHARLQMVADLLAALERMVADRTDGLDEMLAGALEQPQALPQWLVSCSSCIASYADIYHFDFAAARHRQKSASAYQEAANGPFGVIYGYCLAGLAAHEQLDITGADENLRLALQLAGNTLGAHSYGARLASSLLGQLRYEQGRIDEAEALLDASFELGSAGGVADFMIATFATGARMKAARGDRDAAVRRLDTGARIAAARSLPRLAASVEHERVRLGYSDVDSRHASISATGDRSPLGGTELVTHEIQTACAIRRALNGTSPSHIGVACSRAEELVAALDGQRRPRALLNAKILWAMCLAAADRGSEAKDVLVPVIAQCATLGLIRPLVDEGPRMTTILTELSGDPAASPWSAAWRTIPQSFVDALLAESSQLAS